MRKGDDSFLYLHVSHPVSERLVYLCQVNTRFLWLATGVMYPILKGDEHPTHLCVHSLRPQD